jgi:nitrogen-specific signal transduction histidine kinase
MSYALQAPDPGNAGGGGLNAPPQLAALAVRGLTEELRQPLSAIESIAFYLEMVLPRTEGKARRQLGKLQTQLQQIHWILGDAAYFLDPAPAKLQLTDVAEVLSRNVSEWAVPDRPAVHLNLEPSVPLVRLDLDQFGRLLRNLLSFFHGIASSERPIQLGVSAAGTEVLVELSAEAVSGHPAEVQALLSSTEPPWPARPGLALACARKLAQAHNAQIRIQQGPGSAVSVVLALPAGGEGFQSRPPTNPASSGDA